MVNAKARRTPGGPPEDVYIAEDPWCGRIAQGLRHYLNDLIVQHFIDHHPDVTVVAEGAHFTIRIQPMLCDTCTMPAELPYWTHISDPKTNVYNFAGDLIVGDEDGRWLICDTCHSFLTEGRVTPWLRHVVAIARREARHLNTPDLDQDRRAHLAITFAALVRNLDDGTRNTLEDPGELGEDLDWSD